QRLPRRPDFDPISLCITPYPTVEQFTWSRDIPLEADIEFMEKIVHNVRSLRSEYNLLKQTKIALYLRFDTSSTDLEQRLRPLLSTIATLSYCTPVEMLDSKQTCTPTGCVIIPISDHCQAYIHL
ncbi:hypothetical protein BLA29_012187, partial [Euroglyphus maynei]